ncbi:MAG: recombinase family protein, partial [bacterium]|nr:recombinase family protein [bacterium]
MSLDKITPEHLRRKAIVYIRQSTPDQVRHNRESQRRQYALADKATAMGWQVVEVIDEDLGRSGTTTAGRSGFARLVAAVCLREVGVVFSAEASRLARNNRDWYQLLDLCSLMATLIVDFDGVYDPRLLNDRLLLGLKGTMSEFELGLIRQRAHEALRQMAQRGELITCLPIGYARSADGRCEKDPDQRVQHALQVVFTKFAEYGSVRQVLLWCRQEGVMLPALAIGPHGRQVIWRLPVYNNIHKILTNPIYAGAYVFGRTTTRTEMVGGEVVKTRGHRQEIEAWDVLIRDHHEGYIAWEVYERHQQQIRENARMKGLMARGPARQGPSLLSGLLRCARCGRKLGLVSKRGAGGEAGVMGKRMGTQSLARRCPHRVPADPADPSGPRSNDTRGGLAVSSAHAGLLALPGAGGHDAVHGRVAGDRDPGARRTRGHAPGPVPAQGPPAAAVAAPLRAGTAARGQALGSRGPAD